MKTSTIASHYVRAAISPALQRGYDANELLAQAGISEETLMEPKARIYPQKLAQLLKVLSHALNDEMLGHDDKPVRPGTFETLCQLIVPCATLRDALKMGCRYQNLFDFALKASFHDEQGALELIQSRACPNSFHFGSEFQLVIWHRLACWLTGTRIPIETMEFAYARPEHGDEYQYLFYGEHKFNQEKTQLKIAKRFLDLPIIRSRAELPDLLKEAPYVFLVRPNNTASINAQIRRILEDSQNNELADFESVAAQLNTSTQTLRRRLKEEDSSFQAIKDQVRRDMAIYHLSENKFSINEIALKVGFTEPSTFHRAFKKWTGVTPGDYRSGENT